MGPPRGREIRRSVNAIFCREVLLRLRAYPKRGLTLWRQVDFISFWALPERVRPLLGQALSALSRIMKKNFSKHSSLWVGFAILSLIVIGGCGGAAESAPKAPASDAQSSAIQGQSSGPSEQTPEAVVSQFLDGVRRGGAAAEVGKLMTQKAQEQYAAVGLVMQPIGAPDAQFQITRSIPWGDNGALVNSLWTESTPEGEKITYQVGWALRRESAGWRVSGLILDEQPEARVFNFESREDVLAIKQMQDASEPPASDSAPRQADNSDFSMPPLN